MSATKRTKYLVRLLMISLLISALALVYNLYEAHVNIENAKLKYTTSRNTLENNKWDLISGIINRTNSECKNKTEYIKEVILENIKNSYNDNMTQLEIDLNSKEPTFVSEIFTSALSKTFNKKLESSRIFIANNECILADSFSNSKKSKTWKSEIDSTTNKELSKTTLEYILTGKNKILAYVQKHRHDDSIVLEEEDNFIYPDKHNLKYLMNKYGIDVYKKYNIIIVSYITDTGDIFGNNDIGHNGIKANTNKLYVIYEYNLYDIISIYKPSINNIDNHIKQNENLYNEEINRIGYQMIGNIVIMLLSFIGILSSAIVCIKWGGSDEFGRD